MGFKTIGFIPTDGSWYFISSIVTDSGVWVLQGYMDFTASIWGGIFYNITLSLNVSNTGTIYTGYGYGCNSNVGTANNNTNMPYPMQVSTFFSTTTSATIYMYSKSLSSTSFVHTNKSIIRALRIA